MMEDRKNKNELIIFLHGILRSKHDMKMLEWRFQQHGYHTLNILYPSREKSLEDIVIFVHKKIQSSPHYNVNTQIHFVTHSMGGLIARYYIAQQKPNNIGNVVMLGPPNTGSEFADWLTDTKILAPLFKTLFGPAGAQLKTDYTHNDGKITYPLGIIAGSVSINPLSPWVLNGGNDGIVPIERTKIDGMRDHIVIPATHSFMMFNKDVIKQALYFLENTQFNHQK